MKKRLVTRSDFDGLVCAMLFRELDMIDEIKFVHPKDVQDGKIELTSNDITTNLPFSQWTELFENTTMISALVDRLTFRSNVLDMNGPSYTQRRSMLTCSRKAALGRRSFRPSPCRGGTPQLPWCGSGSSIRSYMAQIFIDIYNPDIVFL